MTTMRTYCLVVHKHSGKVWMEYVKGKVQALEYVRANLRSPGVAAVTISEVEVN